VFSDSDPVPRVSARRAAALDGLASPPRFDGASGGNTVITPREVRLSLRQHHDDKSTKATRTISAVTGWLGSFPAILLSVAVVAIWAAGGFFVEQGFSNQVYQLLINTTTTVVTFIMVFIIQNTQNRDGRAIQTKLDAQSEALCRILDELRINDGDGVLTRLVGIEDAPEGDIKFEQQTVRRKAGTPKSSVM
jgi:low affinity Fe/Cu permease